jgi:hypothetical protein
VATQAPSLLLSSSIRKTRARFLLEHAASGEVQVPADHSPT